MLPAWYRKRSYSHFDTPVGGDFAVKVLQAGYVATHPFCPLISFEKTVKRYKPGKNKVEMKTRPIMFASHRDACILSRYSFSLSNLLELAYAHYGISDNVIAYRSLGKSNYHFASEAVEFAQKHRPCMVLAYDITKFFDTLDHALLKKRLKQILGVKELPADWFAVFRHVTKFRHVARTDLEAHSVFGPRLLKAGRLPVATMSELKAAGIAIHRNSAKIGIPQGTPISSTLANLYLIDFDREMAAHAREVGGYYRRYSDDILFICADQHHTMAGLHIEETLKKELLEISTAKTERTLFSAASKTTAQYLGFNLHPNGASIRAASMSRQWRKMRSAIRRIKSVSHSEIAKGKCNFVYTKKLRRRFSSLPLRNFSSYARRSARAMNSKQVLRQARRLEREFNRQLQEVQDSAKLLLPKMPTTTPLAAPKGASPPSKLMSTTTDASPATAPDTKASH